MTKTHDLVMDENAPFTFAGFIQAVLDRVPGSVSRADVDHTLDAFQQTYVTPDLERRFALFADDVVIEDPAGLVRGEGRAGMEAFFRSTFDNGVTIDRRLLERIVVGNEAIERFAMTIGKAGLEPHPLDHVVQYVFDPQGLIRRMRVFFDMRSIHGAPPDRAPA